jgi:hypothetical protein
VIATAVDPSVGGTAGWPRPTEGPRLPTVENVIVATAEAFGLSPDQVGGKARHRDEAQARHLAMYIAHDGLGMSPSEVAKAFDRGHSYSATTRGLERAEIALQVDADVRERTIAVCEQLGLQELATRIRSIMPGGELGLVKVHQELPVDFYKKMATASTIDIHYNTARRFVRDQGDELVHALFAGECHIRMVLTDPDIVTDLGADSALCVFMTPEELRAQYDYSVRWAARADAALRKQKSPSSIELRKRQAPPSCGLLLVDEVRALLTQYLQYSDSRPLFEFVRPPSGGIYISLEDSFSRLWSAAKPVDLRHIEQ